MMLALTTALSWASLAAALLMVVFAMTYLVRWLYFRLSRLEAQRRYETADISETLTDSSTLLRSELKQIRAMLAEVSVLAEPSSRSTQSGHDDALVEYRVVRELAHSLKTPIAGMESILRRKQLERSNEPDPDIADLIASVEICKSILAAYRELTRVSTEAIGWSPASLSGMLNSAHDVYDLALHKTTRMVATLPDSLEGYSTNHVVAILLPLLENAIEASPNGEQIAVSCDEQGNQVVFTIANKVGHPLASPQNGHDRHEGLGLSTVERLVERDIGGRVHRQSADDSFSVTVTLPYQKA